MKSSVHPARGPGFLAQCSRQFSLGGFCSALLFVLRGVIYFVLLWLRTPFVALANLFAVICGVCFAILCVVERGEAFANFWPLLLLSFGSFTVGWLYDIILLWIAPQDILLFQ